MGKTGTQKNLFRFSTIMAVVGLLLGLMATGCSDSGGKGTADIPSGTSNKVSFVYNLLANKTDVANTIVEVGYEFFDAEGNEVLDTIERDDEYLLTHGTSDVEATVVVKDVPLTAKQVLATFYGAKGEALGIGVDEINITANRPQTIADPDVAIGAAVSERLTGFVVTPDPQTIEVGQIAAYVATASYAKTKDATPVTVNLTNDSLWTVADEGVAHILYTMEEVPGSFQGVAAGTTLVSASYEVAGVSFVDDAVLTVGKAMPADVAISLDGETVADDVKLSDVEKTVQLGAYAVLEDGTLGDAVEGTFAAADGATAITVAEDGLVTFVAENEEGVEVTFTPADTELTGDTVKVFTYIAPAPANEVFLSLDGGASKLDTKFNFANEDVLMYPALAIGAYKLDADGKPVAVDATFSVGTPSLLDVNATTGAFTSFGKEGTQKLTCVVAGEELPTYEINVFNADTNGVAIVDEDGNSSLEKAFTSFKMPDGGEMQFYVANAKTVDFVPTISAYRTQGGGSLSVTNAAAAAFSVTAGEEGLLQTNGALTETNNIAEIQYNDTTYTSKTVKVELSERAVNAEGLSYLDTTTVTAEDFLGEAQNIAVQEIAKEGLKLNAVRILSDGTKEAIAGEYKITGDVVTLTPTAVAGQATVALKDATVGGEGTFVVTFTPAKGDAITLTYNVFAATKLAVTAGSTNINNGEATQVSVQYANDTVTGDNEYFAADIATSDNACATVDNATLIVTADATANGAAYIGITKSTAAAIGEYAQTLKGGVTIRVS